MMVALMVAAGFVVFGLTVVDIVGSLLGDEGNGGVWATFLPKRDRVAFVDELTMTLMAVAGLGPRSGGGDLHPLSPLSLVA